MSGEPLLPAPLVVRGHLVTFDDRRPQIPDGALYVDRDGLIVAVSDAGDAPPPGFADANVVDARDAVVYPGLIDLHNHIAYNCLPLWASPTRKEPCMRFRCGTQKKLYVPALSLTVQVVVFR